MADALFPENEDQQDFADGILSISPEQRKLHTETYDFTVGTIFEKLLNKSIFIPNFQRKYVWTDVQASKLIESLIIQCPLPVIYLNQEPNETLSVIDGNQRLTSIKRFLEDSLKLKGLTAYPELEKYKYSELDQRFQRHIQNRTLRCIVILKDTHPQVKFDVFERLNSGATKLNPQELRHGLYFGNLMVLAVDVVKNEKLLSIFEIKHDKRMKAEELVLRFWALNQGLEEYKKPLSIFINQFCERNRSINDEKKIELTKSFNGALKAVLDLLGDLAFRIYDEDLRVQSSFNSALYDALMVGLATLQKTGSIKTITKKQAQLALAKLIKEDKQFVKSISLHTSDDSYVKYRINAIVNLFKK